jgi:hypothetical protein
MPETQHVVDSLNACRRQRVGSLWPSLAREGLSPVFETVIKHLHGPRFHRHDELAGVNHALTITIERCLRGGARDNWFEGKK